ncbi:MAG: motility associated factor glycosyltransferase family protein [Candidatus Adiutrix sp.]
MNENPQNFLNFNLAKTPPREPMVTQGPLGPALVFNGVEIHQLDDPLNQADSWINEGERDNFEQSPELALIFGLGLGWHLKALRARFPNIRLVIFEPEPQILDVYEEHTVFEDLAQNPPTIITAWQEYEDLASREIVYGGQKAIIMMAPLGYRTLKPEAYGTFLMYNRQEMMRRAVLDKTRKNTGAAFLENLAHNASRIVESADLMALKGRLPNRPAFIVGSGPSLSQSAPVLKEVGDRGMIVAAASALKPLLAHGVAPDVVLVLESSDTSDFLCLNEDEKNILGQKTVLALASGCHPAHFKVENFHKAIFHLTAGEAQLFGEGVFLPQGGNAGSAAFALSYCWGLNPLILVAQDQAYDQGRRHAIGTPGASDDEKNQGDITVLGVDNTMVETDSGLLASLNWFAEAAKSINQQLSPPILYNASESGAKVLGFNEVALSAIVASLAPVSGQVELAAALPRIPKPSKDEIVKDLTQLSGLVNTFRRLAKMDHQKAFAELRTVGEISKFLGQILAEASVANSKNELIASLEKADGLLALMLSSLDA